MKENRFANRFKMLKYERNLTDEELGKILGKSRSTIGHYSNGVRKPDIDDLIKIADYFGVTVAWIIGETNDRKSSVYHADVNGHDVAITYKPGEMDREFTYEDALKALKKLESIGIDVRGLLK